MKRNIILLVLLYSISIYSQEKDSIIYIFPDKVEQKLYEQIEKINPTETYNFEFYLQLMDKDTFRLAYTYSEYTPGNYWVKNTNRFILINKRKYPLVFDIDTLFSTSDHEHIGEYGHRDGTVIRHFIIYEGYNITFTKNGECIKENFGLYIPK